MSCLLCFGVEGDENLIDIASGEGRRQNTASTLYTHFGFCFQDEPNEGCVCQKCWVKVSVFHEFYTHIEYVHRSKECIFVENIIVDVKPIVNSDGEKFESEVPPEKDEKPQTAPKRKRGRPRKESKLNYSGPASEDADQYNDNFEITIESSPEPAAEKTEPDNEMIIAENQQQQPTVEKPPITKKCRKKMVHIQDYNEDSEEEDDDDPTWYGCKIPTERPKPNSQQILTKLGTYQCKICKLHFSSFRRLNEHFKRTHDAKEFKCKDAKCLASFDTQELADDHFAQRHKRVECPLCKKMIINVSNHIELNHKTSNVVCELCGKVSLNQKKHSAHLIQAHDPRGTVQCDICGRWYKSLPCIRKHINAAHVRGPQKCDTCGHISPNPRALRDHIKIHDPNGKNRWKCDVCGRGYRDKFKLAEHYHIHTGTAGSYHCDQCGKRFRFSSSFSVHKKTMHPK